MPINIRTPQQKAQRQERQLGVRLGGKVTKGSGNGFEKGDVRVKGVARIECKSTEAASFTVTRHMLSKIDTAALNAGEEPALVVRFMHNGNTVDEFAIVPMSVLEDMYGI